MRKENESIKGNMNNADQSSQITYLFQDNLLPLARRHNLGCTMMRIGRVCQWDIFGCKIGYAENNDNFIPSSSVGIS